MNDTAIFAWTRRGSSRVDLVSQSVASPSRGRSTSTATNQSSWLARIWQQGEVVQVNDASSCFHDLNLVAVLVLERDRSRAEG